MPPRGGVALSAVSNERFSRSFLFPPAGIKAVFCGLRGGTVTVMLGLSHAECLTLTIGAFLAVRSVLASQAEQKTIRSTPLQPELSEVVHECLSTEAELARRLEAAEAALAAKDAELTAERAVAREAVAQAVAAREATVRAQAARASAEQAAAEVVVAAELVQAQARGALEEARIAHVAELKAKDDSLDAAREAIPATSAGAETNAQALAASPAPPATYQHSPGRAASRIVSLYYLYDIYS